MWAYDNAIYQKKSYYGHRSTAGCGRRRKQPPCISSSAFLCQKSVQISPIIIPGRDEERRMRAGPGPGVTPGPAPQHSTCYSMDGSTRRKNTNFHAFMALASSGSSKKSRAISKSYLILHACIEQHESVLQVSKRHWETNRTEIQCNGSNSSNEAILRETFDVHQGSRAMKTRRMIRLMGYMDLEL